MRQYFFLGIVFVASITWLASVTPASSATRQVVVIYDERTSLPGLAAIDASIVSTLTAESPETVQIYSESMDLSRFGSADHIENFRNYLRTKYADRKINVAIAVLPPALDFLLNYGQTIFPGAAIVFCGVEKRQLRAGVLPANVTGVLVKRQFSPTLEIALALQPDTERVVMVAGTSKFDTDLLAQAKEEFHPYEDRLAFTYLTTLPMSELLSRLSKLPPHTIILYTTLFRDGAGEAFVPHDVLQHISEIANAPVYGFLDQYMGRGIVGGSLYSVALQGQEAAKLTLRILAGAAPSTLPVLAPDANKIVFDWRQLQRWGLPESLLPANSEVRFRELSVWDQYQRQIILIGMALLLQSALIGVLLYEYRRRRRAEASASKLQSDLAHVNRVTTAGELTGSIAHEIRQPLAAMVIHGSAGLRWLQNKTPNLDEARLALQRIVSEGHRADAIINNIRAMFRHESTPRMLVDVNELFLQILPLVTHKLGSNNIALETNFAKKAVPFVRADSVQLQQVVLNLIMNAVEAMVSSAARARVLRLRTEVDPAGIVLITISDTGPGIDPQMADNIFQPFFTTKPGGMGMGLSICKSIIEAHEGQLRATPGEPNGTVFQISLPQPGAKADEISSSPSTIKSSSPTISTNPSAAERGVKL